MKEQTQERKLTAEEQKSLNIYIEEKHTQEECIGFIDGLKACPQFSDVKVTDEEIEKLAEEMVVNGVKLSWEHKEGFEAFYKNFIDGKLFPEYPNLYIQTKNAVIAGIKKGLSLSSPVKEELSWDEIRDSFMIENESNIEKWLNERVLLTRFISWLKSNRSSVKEVEEK